MTNIKLTVLTLAVSFCATAAVPRAVEAWQEAHPNAPVIGWRYIRHIDQPTGIYLLKTLELGAVSLRRVLLLAAPSS